MPPSTEKRIKWVNTRFTSTEYVLLQTLYKQSNCRALSEYMRKVLLQKPVSVRYRNTSVDDFLADMLSLRKELNAIGNNFNQAVLRLHVIDRHSDLQQWVLQNEQDKTFVFRQIETIHQKINQLYQLWSQE